MASVGIFTNYSSPPGIISAPGGGGSSSSESDSGFTL